MVSKRGVGPIIATVLLLGFAVALATTIFLWMSGQTETLSESTVEYVEGEMQCQNVRMNVIDKSIAPEVVCSELEVSNMGYLTLDFVSVREFCTDGDAKSGGPLSVDLPPKSSKTEETGEYKTSPPLSGFCSGTDHCNGCKKVEIMPVITISNRKAGCKDKTVMVECS